MDGEDAFAIARAHGVAHRTVPEIPSPARCAAAVSAMAARATDPARGHGGARVLAVAFAAALVAAAPGAWAQSADEPRTKDVEVWSSTMVTGTLSDRDGERGWRLWGFFRGFLGEVGRLDDDTFTYKGKSRRVSQIVELQTGPVSVHFDGSRILVPDAWSFELQIFPPITVDEGQELLTLHIDQRGKPANTVRKFNLRDDVCTSTLACVHTWTFDSDPYITEPRSFDYSFPVKLTRRATNQEPTGEIAVTREVSVLRGQEFVADASTIADGNGLSDPGYEYQWIRIDGEDETEIAGATGLRYSPTADDIGRALKFRVRFVDDDTFDETLASEPTAEVRPLVKPTGVTFVSEAAGGVYRAGEAVEVEMTFSQAVDVAVQSGVKPPAISLQVGGAARDATYRSGSGTDTLTFAWDVPAGVEAAYGLRVNYDTLTYTLPSVIHEPGHALNHASTFHPAARTGDTVDSKKPTLRFATASGNGTSLSLVYDEALSPDGPPASALTVTADGTEVGVDGLLQGGAETPNQLVLALSSPVRSGQVLKLSYADGSGDDAFAIQDLTGNDAEGFTVFGVENHTQHGPTAVSISSDPDNDGRDGNDGTYAKGDGIEVILTFSADLTVTGTPQLALGLDGSAKQAGCSAGLDASQLVCTYSVGDGDAAAAGIRLEADALTLNGGGIAAGDNPAALNLPAPATYAGHRVDGVAPRLVNAAVNADTLVLEWSEALNGGVTPANSTFTVGLGTGTPPTVSAVNASGRRATLTLSSAVAASDTVTLTYAPPSAMALEDAVGNPAVGFSAEAVTNQTGSVAAPSVSSVALSSSAGEDDTYAIGDVIEARATFTGAVSVDAGGGTPQLALNVGGASKSAAYVRGSGTAALTFAYTVKEDDSDADGVSIDAGALSPGGGTIRKVATGIDAALTHVGAGADAGQMVDGDRPAFASAATTADGKKVVVTFDEALDSDGGVGNGAFLVRSDGRAVALTGTPAVSDRTVTLGLAVGLTRDRVVTVSYTDASASDDSAGVVQDGAGNDADTFTGRTVDTGNAPRPAPTVLALAFSSDPNDDARAGDDHTYAVGDAVEATVTFSANVDVEDASGKPTLALVMGDSTVAAEYRRGTGTAQLVFGHTVEANDSAPAGVAVDAGELQPNGGTIRVPDTETDADLRHGAVRPHAGHRVDGVPPTATGAGVDADTLTLQWSEPLAPNTALPASAFTVSVGSGPATAASVAEVDGSTVTLTLSGAVLPGDTVGVAYAKPTAPGAVPIEDVAGNDAAGFTLALGTVTNDTLPVVSIAAVSGDLVEGTDTAAQFTLTRTGTGANALRVTVLVEESDDPSRPLAVGRYFNRALSVSEEVVNFAAGATTATLSYAIDNDAVAEPPGALQVRVRQRPGYAVEASAASAQVRVSDNDEVPGKPGLRAFAGDGEVTLIWTVPAAGTSPIQGYDLHRSGDGGRNWQGWELIPDSATLTILTVPDLDNGTEYAFQVRAYSEAGGGVESDAVKVTPKALTLSGDPVGAETIWSATLTPGARSGVVGYSASLPTGMLSDTTFDYPDSNTTHTVRALNSDSTELTFAITGGGVGTAAGQLTLLVGEKWSGKLREAAFASRVGLGFYTWPLPPTLTENEPVAVALVETETPPDPPTDVSAGPVATLSDRSMRVAVSWAAPLYTGTSALTGYKVERATSPSGPWTQAHEIAAETTTLTDTGLAVATTYYYRVRAVNSEGDSAPSATVYATTYTAANIPGPPPGADVPFGWGLKPTGLAVGSKFRLLFISSTTRDAASADIADYNAHVQGAAAAGHADIRAYGAGSGRWAAP